MFEASRSDFVAVPSWNDHQCIFNVIVDERFQQQSPGPVFPVILGSIMRCSVATRKPERKDIMTRTGNTVWTHNLDKRPSHLFIWVFWYCVGRKPVSIVLCCPARSDCDLDLFSVDDLFSRWTGSNFVFVNWFTFCKDEFGTFQRGFNITLCVLFLDFI